MNIRLERAPSSEHSTISKVYVDGQFECYILEDVVRAIKIYGQTAIPVGVYPIVITYSNHFGRDLPLLVGVGGYEGVRIHPGNTAKDTEGCLLPGTTCGVDEVGNSRVAFEALYAKIQTAIAIGEPVTLTVEEAA
jgi:hypothetical protein